MTGAGLVAVALVVGLLPGSASADTIEATAFASGRGAEITLLSPPPLLDEQTAPRVADTDPDGDGVAECIAADDPDGCVTGPGVGSLVSLPLLDDLLSAGVVAQDAFVDDLGVSFGCSGVVTPGGVVSVDATPEGCVFADPQVPGGIVINLTSLGLVRLRVGAIESQCVAVGPDPANGFDEGFAFADSQLVNVVVEVGAGILGLYTPVLTLPLTTPPNTDLLFPNTFPLAGLLNDLVSVRTNVQEYSPEGDAVSATALHLRVLNAIGGTGLLDIKLGQVSCGANTAALVPDPDPDDLAISLDSSGDIRDPGDFVQPQTQNAVGITYAPTVDQPDANIRVALFPGLSPDLGRGLPAGCTTSALDGEFAGVDAIDCALGAVDADDEVELSIPALVDDDAPFLLTASALAFGATTDDILSEPIATRALRYVEQTFIGGEAGGTARPDPQRTGLAADIPGDAYLNLPDWVEAARYGGDACAVADPPFDPVDEVYPELAGTVVWDCGASTNDATLELTYADDAPATDAATLGRMVIVRDTAGADPALAVGNSYYADLVLFVGAAPEPPAPPPTPPTTAPPTVAPTTAAPPTTVAGTKIPRTGAESDLTLVFGLGFVGLGLVLTGQGMELGAGGRFLRRRP